MKPLRVARIGNTEQHLLDLCRTELAREFRVPCTIDAASIDPSFAHHPERNQFHSTRLLELLANDRDDSIIVGITDVDLYIPILTFVFGEAQLGGRAAIVSDFRLHQTFYGLPRDDSLLRERLVKEAIHEVGHVVGLTHCDDYECVMASSHAVEWVDLKTKYLCEECRASSQLAPTT
jgi:archaemetzincin